MVRSLGEISLDSLASPMETCRMMTITQLLHTMEGTCNQEETSEMMMKGSMGPRGIEAEAFSARCQIGWTVRAGAETGR
jgi:hypothetical protein